MRVQRRKDDGSSTFELLDGDDQPFAEVHGFQRHLSARGCSPNTLCAYAHDLLHFYQFLELTGLNVDHFGVTAFGTPVSELLGVKPTGRRLTVGHSDPPYRRSLLAEHWSQIDVIYCRLSLVPAFAQHGRGAPHLTRVSDAAGQRV